MIALICKSGLFYDFIDVRYLEPVKNIQQSHFLLKLNLERVVLLRWRI